jgi:predicted Fe-S protein YdhL (DUF1289 family)
MSREERREIMATLPSRRETLQVRRGGRAARLKRKAQ